MRLKQVIINLIGNAIKFTSNGEVLVRLNLDAATGAPASLDVQDSGIGIPEEKHEKIFEPFQQAETSTSRTYGGTGLGLTICREFAQLMGFELRLKSVEGKGSTFTITFGYQGADQSTIHIPSKSPAESLVPTSMETIKALKVVLIDDDLDALELLHGCFLELGCDVTKAHGGEEGLKRVEEILPDLITLDLKMPEVSGWEVQARLQSNPATKDIPVVVISTMADETRAAFLGSTEFVNKPFSQDDISRIVQSYASGQGKTALIVEDDKDARALMRDLLVERGLNIVEAENGVEGLERLNDAIPDVIFLDLMMPVMDGMSFLSVIRHDEELAGIPVVVVTAKDLDLEEKQILDEWTDMVISKGARLEHDLAFIVDHVKGN
jgi:CheY-like chemotaxis protein